MTELVKRGVTKATAADLVQRHPAPLIEAKIEVFDWLVEKQDKRLAKSPAGYLVKSLADDYATPKGFMSRAAPAAGGSAAGQGTPGGRGAPPEAGGSRPRESRAPGRPRLSQDADRRPAPRPECRRWPAPTRKRGGVAKRPAIGN